METQIEARKSVAPHETVTQALHRLVRQARENGPQMFVYDLANGRGVEYYVTSASWPGTLHRTTLISCDCQAFQR